MTLAALSIAVFISILSPAGALTAEEAGGGIAARWDDSVIYNFDNSPPHDVDFTFEPSDPDNGLIVLLNASAVDDEGDVLSYYWDFGDGESASGSNVTHQFTMIGANNVTLSVDDGVEGPDPRPVSIAKTVTVTENSPPSVAFWTDYWHILPRAVYGFETNFTEVDTRDTVRLTWIWDDGTTDVMNATSTGGMVSTKINHSFNEQGGYDVTVWADDLTAIPGHNVSDRMYVLAWGYNNDPWITSFGVGKSSPYTGELVTFFANVTDQDHDVCHLTFDFGDGTYTLIDQPWNAKTTNVPHIYDSPGTYWAILTVIDYHVPGSGGASTSAASNPLTTVSIPINITVSKAVFNLNLVEGWNLVSVPLVNCSCSASDLGLDVGDLIVGFNVSTHAYDRPFIFGGSPPACDFMIEESTGYWIYSHSAKEIQVCGSLASSGETRMIPNAGWAMVGFNTRNLTWHASDVPGMFTGGNVSVVTHLLQTGVYESYIVGLGHTDFILAPGEGYWCYFMSGGVLSYGP